MEYHSKGVNHLGIVAATCEEIGLIEAIDDIIIPDPQQKVSTGEAVKAMVTNALGFTSKPLYLFPEFMEKKPTGLLFDNHLRPEDFNDDTLGRALDRLYEHNPTRIFMRVSLNARNVMGLTRTFCHLDTTTMSVHGDYENAEDDMVPITITHGKSKDGRDDLKQYLISMITTSKADIPIWIDALSGNTSDKTHFREVIKQYAEQLAENEDTVYFVVDSAGYTAKNIREMPVIVKWISRVPETITQAKNLLLETEMKDLKESNLEGYRVMRFSQTYAEVDQNWVVVFSQKSYVREMKTLLKRITKEKERVTKDLWHFKNKEFKCEQDALQTLKDKEKKWKYHRLKEHEMIVTNKTGKRGRPKKNSKSTSVVYQIKATVEEDEEAISLEKKRKGKFILATNDKNLDAETILVEYKAQQGVERGFRFLKDPLFFTSSTFLKKPQRIVSLVMIMGLSLLIYSLAQWKLRKALEEMNATIPDQKGKPTKKPTMRRIFQMFEGIELLEVHDEGDIRILLLNMKEVHRKILILMGEPYEKMYLLR